VIAVRVNNNAPTSRWYSGSGIYRNVWLTVLNPTHVDYCGMFVTTPEVKSSWAAVNIKTKIVNQSGASQSVQLTTAILDANGKCPTHRVRNLAASETTPQPDLPHSVSRSPSSPYFISPKPGQDRQPCMDTISQRLEFALAFDPNTGFSLMA
jgi:beta-galactosidase